VAAMNVNHNDQTKTLEDVFDWSEHYLKRYKEINTDTDLEVIKVYRTELKGFISYIFSRWMGVRLGSLKEENRELLNDVYKQLTSIELYTANRIIELNRDQEARINIESLPLPESSEHNKDVDYKGWRMAPLHYGERLFKKINRSLFPK
jgi:hypothetical protein